MLPLLFVLAAAVSFAQAPGIQFHPIVRGLQNPLEIGFSDDNTDRMFILEQVGRIRIVKNGQLLATPFLNIAQRISSGGERGLLGLAFPPGYSSKRYFYVNYTDPQGDTVVARFRVSSNEDVADPGSEEVILRVAQPFANHNGGCIRFGPKDGFLYIGMGDGGSAGDPQNNGQSTNALLGKMLRIDVESGQQPYRVPPDNPFANRQGYRPEIWATGLRNPWRFSFDRETRDLWIADVGQNRAEEVNYQPASSTGGENYGWRLMEGQQCYSPSNCSQTGLTMPVIEYGRQLGSSVTGGYVYRGSRFPSMRGRYLYADFGNGNTWSLTSAGGAVNNALVLASGRTISAFGEDRNGELYAADYSRGEILALTAAIPSVTAQGVVNAASFAAGLVPGSLATVFGTNLTAFPGVVQSGVLPLPTELASTSVTINGAQVPIIATAVLNGQEQINFQIPWTLSGQSQATVVVNANGRVSDSIQISLASAQPEIFAVTRNAAGFTVWATGLGPVDNVQTAGQAPATLTRTTTPAEVFVNGANQPVSFSGLAPGYVGLYQINVTGDPAVTGEVVLSIGSARSKPFPLAL